MNNFKDRYTVGTGLRTVRRLRTKPADRQGCRSLQYISR